jgi:hypothetical protein
MSDSNQITFPPHLEPLAAQILAFAQSESGDSGDTMLLDHELTKKDRYTIHSYIESLDLYSESIALKGTSNKKICLHRHGERKDLSEQNRAIDNEDVDCFSSNVGAPYPCTDPDMVEYFNDVFDPMFGTKAKWALFLSERRDDGMAVRKEIVTTREKICRAIRDSPNYRAYQKLRLRGQSNRIRGDVYHHGSDGKTFVSLDIKSANFTCARLICPELFTGSGGSPMSWGDFVRTLTDSEFVAQSKIFREIVFGKLGFCKGANVLQEAIMEKVDQVLKSNAVLSAIFNTRTIRMKCGDEIVYELSDDLIHMEGDYHSRPLDILLHSISNNLLQNAMREIKVADIPILASVFDALDFDADVELGDIFHIRAFQVDKIGSKKYFVKTFRYRSDWNCIFTIPDHCQEIGTDRMIQGSIQVIRTDMDVPLRQLIEFKRVDKKFYLQVLKYHQGLPIESNDLYFTDSGVMAKYCHSIFD